MAVARLLNMEGALLGSVDLNDAVFNVEPHPVLVHDVVVALRNAQRQGNAETKTRKDVRGGGRKPYRQKGTGHARHGSTREPQMRGGGTVWGPHKRSYRQDVPAGFKRKALCCVLSDRVRRDALCVLDALRCPTPKTKPFAETVGKFSPDGKSILFVTAESDRNLKLSARNLRQVTVREAADVNALDVLNAARVVIVQEALPKLEERLS